MPTARISELGHRTLQELARKSGESRQAILDRALELLRRQHFWDEANTAYAALRADPEAWRQELEERALWDSTLLDGMEEDDE